MRKRFSRVSYWVGHRSVEAGLGTGILFFQGVEMKANRVMWPVALVLIVIGALAGLSVTGAPDSVEEAPVLDALYAAPVEEIEEHVLARGETLDRVLGRATLSGREQAGLLLALREYKNPRHLQPGVEVKVRRWRVDGNPRAIELRLNADSLIRLAQGPVGWESEVRVTPTTTDTVYLEGAVEQGRTIYETLVSDDQVDLPRSERVALVADLAEIYAFKLAFTHDIQAGDRYRLVYEREVRPDGTSRRRRVLIAELENRGRLFQAIHFDSDDVYGGYYDDEGESLRGAFRRYPLDYVRITSAFSPSRYHPVLGRHRAHLGTDFGAPTGTPIKATADGAVVMARRNGGYGNMIELRHPGGYTTRYAHLSRFAGGIRPGVGVEQGQVIGYVGATGLATGPHVHYELRRNGQPLNPRTAKLPGAPPIPDSLRDTFLEVAEDRIALLEAIPWPGPRLAGPVEPTIDEASGEG